MNPLINNPITQMIQKLQGCNPQQVAQNILANNPDAKAFINQMQSDCGQQNPKDYVLNVCKNKGVSTEHVMQLANMLGLE